MKIDGSLMFEARKCAQMAPQLEAVGFDGAYSFDGQGDPFVALSASAMTTEKLELMTSIAVAFSRNPMTLAYLGDDLQKLSEGRFILGLGTQVKSHIERRFSMPWSKPAARMREMVEAIKTIWRCWETGERLNYQGEFYQHTLMSPTFSPGKNEFGAPPIYLAGVGPLMTRTAGEVADGYFVHPFSSAHSLDTLSLPAIAEGRSRSGKTMEGFQVSGQMVVATGLDEQSYEAAVFSARNQIAFYGSTPAYLPVLEAHGWESMHAQWLQMAKDGKWMDMAASVNDEMLHTFAAVGTIDEVGEKIMARARGRFDRVSPVIYEPNIELLTALITSIRKAQ